MKKTDFLDHHSRSVLTVMVEEAIELKRNPEFWRAKMRSLTNSCGYHYARGTPLEVLQSAVEEIETPTAHALDKLIHHKMAELEAARPHFVEPTDPSLFTADRIEHSQSWVIYCRQSHTSTLVHLDRDIPCTREEMHCVHERVARNAAARANEPPEYRLPPLSQEEKQRIAAILQVPHAEQSPTTKPADFTETFNIDHVERLVPISEPAPVPEREPNPDLAAKIRQFLEERQKEENCGVQS